MIRFFKRLKLAIAPTIRIDSEGRDVTFLPGLWEESDRFKIDWFRSLKDRLNEMPWQ